MEFEPIAIVGRSCLFPGALTPDQLWENVLAGRDTISPAPEGRWRIPKGQVLSRPGSALPNQTPTDRGGYVTGFDEIFQPEGFVIPAAELLRYDVSVRWLLHTAREALRDSRIDTGKAPKRTGLTLGVLSLPTESFAEYAESVWAGSPRPDQAMNRFHPGLSAQLVARALGVVTDETAIGPFALDAACASSLYSIKLACDQLQDGSRDLMLAGAVSRADDLFLHLGFAALRALSPSGRSRPFHAQADGLLPAEGAGFVLLKRLADALRDGDRIHAVIRGIGLSNDGRSAGLLSPSVREQEQAIRLAYALAQLEPSEISLMECHATGTPVGDATEIGSAGRVFEGVRGLPIGSIKSNLGHPLTAAGMAGLMKICGAFRARVRPRTLHVRSRSEAIREIAASPFRLLTENESWDESGPRRAALNGFGFGGNNAHMIVEEWAGQEYARKRSIPGNGSPRIPAIALVAMGAAAGSAQNLQQFTGALFFGSLRSRRTDGIALAFEGLGFPPSDLQASLPQQTFALQVAAEAIAQTTLSPSQAGRSLVAVFVGAECDPESARSGLKPRRLAGQEMASDISARDFTAAGVTGSLTNMVANRVSNAHDLHGPSFLVASGELSGIDALRLACQSLRRGEVDAAVVGAVDLSNEAVHQTALRAMDPDHPVETGDAAVFFVLKRMEDAERDVADRNGRILAEVDPRETGSEAEASVSSIFGRAHAASGLLEAAGAALCCFHGALYPARPWISEAQSVLRAPPGESETARAALRFARCSLEAQRARPAPPESEEHASTPGRGRAPFCAFSSKGRRVARIRVKSLGGATATMSFASVAAQPVEPLLPPSPPRLIVCSADARAGLKTALAHAWKTGIDCSSGSMRLAILAADETEWTRKQARAQQFLDSGVPAFSGDGIHFRVAPIGGELAFVFPGAGSSYAGMGNTLLAAFPEVTFGLLEETPKSKASLGWLFESAPLTPKPEEKLAATIFLSQAHARFTRFRLGLKPSAAIGMSAGETSAMLAFDVWRHGDDFFQEFLQSGVFSRYLSGAFEVVGGAAWESWILLMPEADLYALLAEEPGLRLLAIQAPGEYLIGGDTPTCGRAVARAGRTGAQPVDFPMVIHCPEAGPFASQWRQLHTRETWPPPHGVRIYGMSQGKAYEVTKAAAADALTAQALQTLNYPRVIRQAWDDGVRIFVEHGARGSCTSSIRRILSDREHLAIALDSPVVDSLTQMIDAAAQLIVAGVPVNLEFLTRLEEARSRETHRTEKKLLRLDAHAPPVVIPVQASPQVTPPLERSPAEATPPPIPLSLFESHAKQVALQHSTFLEMSLAAHQRFLAASQDALHQLLSSSPGATMTAVAVPSPAPRPPSAPHQRPIVWNREQLEITASGRISSVFGKQFEAYDTYARICRLPMPPMLLADRITRIEGQPGSMGLGSLEAETDVREDSWFLLRDRIPAGLMIESGQADMLLISWLGVDFHNKGERVYRMLGCEVTFHGGLARPGDTLRYHIRITGHARQGGIRLFFFEYDCYIGTKLALSVRKGQAGFFSYEDLAASIGVLWDPLTTPPSPHGTPPSSRMRPASRYTEQEVLHAADGRVFECFGRGYELAAAQQRPPAFARPELLQFDTVAELNFDGGPWRRGYLRSESTVKPDSFLFTSHFKDDPCLPGTVMLEGCYQMMAFYMMAMGLTLKRDGWRFEPLLGEALTVACRGQVLPTSRKLIAEIFIDEFIEGDEPVLIADTLGTVDGLRAFHGHRLGLRLVPGNPLDSRPATTMQSVVSHQKPAVRLNGVLLDEEAMLHTAIGWPSRAFGAPYARFDANQRCPRLPGPPYLFISRITGIAGEFGVETAGCRVEAEYVVRPGDWYFSDNTHAEMPYSILLEVALQPCGWLSCFTGIPIHRQEELFFRNLDGTAELHRQVPARDAIITTRATLRNLSKFGSITLVSFDVQLSIDGQPLLDLKTSFGFFSEADLLGQTGLPPNDEEAVRLASPSQFYCDLRTAPERYFRANLRMASGRLLMIDEITGLTVAAGLPGGWIRARKHIRPEEWFFKAHFYQDPVQPGSLGLDAILQTLQLFAIHRGLGGNLSEPQFAIDKDSVWRYRGQVTPPNKTVETEVIVHDVIESDAGTLLRAEGWLWVDGLRVYHLSKIGLRIVGKRT